MEIRRRNIIIAVGIAALMFMSATVAAISDNTNDIWHQTFSATGLSYEAWSGSNDKIDITDITYSLDGSTATLTMKTVGDIVDSENVVYSMHLTSTEESSFYMVTYTNGEGMVMGVGDFAGYYTQLETPVSGNTLTASFEINDPSGNYVFHGFNGEYNDIGEVQGEQWWDYAPNENAPWFGLDDGDDDGNVDGDSDGDGNSIPPKPNTPGFEVLLLLASIGIAFILKRKRNN